MKALYLLMLVGGCGWNPWRRHDAQRSITPLEQVRDRADLYRTTAPSRQDPNGFVDTDHCDSTLFSGLLGASGVAVELAAAEDPDHPGRWYRRPVAGYAECWSSGASRSTISRDMLLGVVWWAWSNTDLAMLERLWDYGSARSWVMGDDHVGGLHTVMNPTMIRLLAEAIYAMGGENHELARAVPFDWDAAGEMRDFEAHLKVVQIALAGEILGSINDTALATLRAHTARQPHNPLFQAALHRYTDGDQTAAATLLLNEAEWPADRLPTSAEHCSSWPTERDAGADWEPCDGGRIHSAGEYLFILRVIDGRPG